jgi:hypothetical protein
MNALHPNATGRRKQDIATIRHIYLVQLCRNPENSHPRLQLIAQATTRPMRLNRVPVDLMRFRELSRVSAG